MQRRIGTAGKSAKKTQKTAHLKKAAPKRGVTAKVARAGSAAAAEESEVERLRRELKEAQEQQAATAEVLRVISSSPGELEPVFSSMLENATRICGAKFGQLYRFQDGAFHLTAGVHIPPDYADFLKKRGPFLPSKGSQLDRAMKTKRASYTADMAADATPGSPARLGGARSAIAVPMLKDGKLIGAFSIYRQEVRPFTAKQIELVQNFAAQAVIAIENTRLLSELRESLEQQTATSDVLRVISSSPGELEPVFETILNNATRICGARFGALNFLQNGALHVGAMHNVPAPFAEFLQRGAYQPKPGSLLDRAIQTRQVAITDDNAAEASSRAWTLGGARSTICMPMLKDDAVIGTFTIYRQEVRPFTPKQVALLENFAAQAVIAIENARLLNELRQRTMDLTESLEQQTATSDVLRVISSSPGELEPVFKTILENATRICGAEFGHLFRYEDGTFRAIAMHNTPLAFEQFLQEGPILAAPGTGLARIASDPRTTHITDVTKLEAYAKRDPFVVAGAELGHVRTLLIVPMLKDAVLIGVIAIFRQEVRPFTEKQIELVTNFAAQAVIAIENTRLLSELRQSLEQQTATADVLRVISSSPGELEPVFQAMLKNATRICEAKFGIMLRFDGELFELAAELGTPHELHDFLKQRGLFEPVPNSHLGRVLATKQVSHTADYAADNPDSPPVRFAGARSTIDVPMLKDGKLIGAFSIYRQEVRPFTGKQIELVQNFAAQAVIAIENTRLLNELRESLEQQTATSEVLSVISSSPGELEPVFQAMLANAVRICDSKFGTLFRYDDETFEAVALFGTPPALTEFHQKRGRFRPAAGAGLERVARTKDVIHIADETAEPTPSVSARLAGARSVIVVPMLKDDQLIGAISIYRAEVRPFTEKQTSVVKNFAAQAVIAIENTRLLNELRQRTDDLSKSLEDLRTAQDRLVQSQKLASLGQLTAGIAHEIKNPLNFVNNFSGLSVELVDELTEALAKVNADDQVRADIGELAGTLRGNMEKIVQHGKRADSIVKNMLLHSRDGSGEHRPVDINGVVEEALNLAYHGARAEKQGFNITLERAFDPAAGQVDIYPQEVTRVLLNLITNGFYAATKRKNENGDDGYEPTLSAATKSLGDRVEIRIRDNGTGIPREVKEKMFNPFFTTKPAGEGTGLGLSISHDIIVKQHSGTIEVDTAPGEFTEFRIVLPRAAAFPISSGDKA